MITKKMCVAIAALALMVAGTQAHPFNHAAALQAMLVGPPDRKRIELHLRGQGFNDSHALLLKDIPRKFPNLTYLNLELNELTTLPPEICDLGCLEVLVLHDNKLTTLPKEIGNLKNW